MSFNNFYTGKTVLVTGHTGFKGAWLSEWLIELGAHVVGFAQKPHTTPALFTQLGLSSRMDHRIGDIRDQADVARLIKKVQPDVCFHLAAQPLVRYAYKNPIETYSVNVMGTVHLLHALSGLDKRCAAIFVTTDKCYDNKEWHYGYREEDPLGGHDPYSSSKAAAEIAIQSFRKAFFSIKGGSKVGIASVRAGNVLGGGDWADDRLMVECMRYLESGASIPVRNPDSTRPWQHVLEPLSGYLLLAQRIGELLELGVDREDLESLCSAFNFGPLLGSNKTVRDCVDLVLKYWKGEWHHKYDASAPHEAGRLQLSIDKVNKLLAWHPVWDFERTICETVTWYQKMQTSSTCDSAKELTQAQIKSYTKDAHQHNFVWAQK